ncbi:hypothetical protein E2C01_038043 [Portunus trituberculatus]|uniref:Uncharacterized protein n=1 Tax=Portunus trituberculatus TaxID=210409 RepID=A0A5B7FGJ7_PORTR|nr:hypothetical protein [Portunus trituberculatus]
MMVTLSLMTPTLSNFLVMMQMMIVMKVTLNISEHYSIDKIEPMMDHGWHLMSDLFNTRDQIWSPC